MAKISSELKLPLTPRILPFVRAHVRELAALSKLPPDRVEALLSSVVEACTNIMKYAFHPEQADTLIIKSELTPSALTVSLIDEGIPFDQSFSPPCPPPPDLTGPFESTPGLGLCLIRNLVDEMQWINHGKAGKELRLVLYDVQSDIVGQSSEEQLPPFGEDETPAPEQHYLIRRLQSGDAARVSRLVFRAYGYTYPIEDLYYPERIISLNQAGKLISVVAESEAGDIVGHCALKRPAPSPVAEVGQAVVNPAHRGRNLLERMHLFLEQEGLREGVKGLAIFPVTSHTSSQKVAEHLHARACGLVLGLLPSGVVFRRLVERPLSQRESCLFYFKYLKPPEMSRIYPPDHHRDILRKIYRHLGVPVEFMEPALPAGSGCLEVQFHAALGIGEILVQRIGVETSVEVRRARKDLVKLAAAASIYLLIPLNQPGAPELCRQAEGEGFFFSALCPGFAKDGDALRLQFLNTPIDLSLLQVSGSFPREIHQYVMEEREGVGSRKEF